MTLHNSARLVGILLAKRNLQFSQPKGSQLSCSCYYCDYFLFLAYRNCAIVYSTKVNSLLATGDIEGAKSASKTAKLFVNISVVLGILAAIFYVLVFSGGGYSSGC